MLLNVRRKVVFGIGVMSLGVLAVACSGAPQLSSTAGGFQASIGGFSMQVPEVKLPFVSSSPAPGQSQTVTTTQGTLQGVVHSGEACPIALPQ